MRVKKAGSKVFGAVLTAAEKKAMEMEINRQVVEADRRYADDIDAMVLYTLHVHLGFGKKRLREFYDAFSAEHDRLIQYYQMPDETAETLKDGWLHTGDKGYMDEDGYLFINGRVKNLIILSNGENISPEEIENKLALNPLVGEVIVTGEDNGLTARIYPEQAVVEAKALDTEMIRSQLQEFLDEYNKNQPTYRRITGLVIRKNPFIRSTTKKIRRQDVLIDEPLE